MHTNPEVLALMALGEDTGTPVDRQHVTTCPACSEEVAELARIADVGRTTEQSGPLAAPSPEVWRRISAELGFDAETGRITPSRPAQSDPRAATVTPMPPPRNPSTRNPSRRPPQSRSSAARRFVALAVAAALALVVGVGVGITYERRVTQPENRIIASANLDALPQFPGATGTAEVTADGRGGRELVVKMSSPQPIDGTVAVWLMDSKGTATLMGQMENGVARLPIRPGMSLFERPTIDISDEPADDPDPNAHNGRTILRGVLV